MNTGIGDAINLAWKLAEIVKGQASPALLDSYEDERIGFARQLVDTTDRGFALAVSKSFFARLIRLRLLPLIAPTLFRFTRLRRLIFRTLSQIGITYRGISPNQGRAGDVVAGDRLPWIAGENGLGNFAPLKGVGWQVHVFGTARPDVASFCKEKTLFLYQRPLSREARQAGFQQDALYLVRPDGHVGFASPGQDIAALRRYWNGLHV